MRQIVIALFALFALSVFATNPAGADSIYTKKVFKLNKPESEAQTEISADKKETAYKKRITYLYPNQIVRKRIHFKPWANPTKRQTLKIMRIEEGIWGGPSQYNRIYCESKFKSDWVVGQYSGLLMISADWWDYVWPKTPKRIVYKTEHQLRLPVYRITLWSNGKRYKKVVNQRNVKLLRIHIGRLPKRTNATHGWAAVRVGQRAITGGPPASWECSL